MFWNRNKWGIFITVGGEVKINKLKEMLKGRGVGVLTWGVMWKGKKNETIILKLEDRRSIIWADIVRWYR